jgi:hypothetical protein
MKKHNNKITVPEQDPIAWWLAGEVTIREMARLPEGTQLPDTLDSNDEIKDGVKLERTGQE